MNSILNRFVTLPRSAQIGLMVMACGSPIGLLAILGSSGIIPWTVVVVILIGLALLGLVLVFYRYLLVRRKKRKAQPFEREIQSSGGAVPQAVSDVADRARLDDMRKKFERGVTTFKQHGKDLYGLPWYVVIGEPGSGKSEALRHCGIGFPPGLQDELQGTGGTINMDWWFTNQAVILDTAGRLTFGDVESTDTREWKEFLRLLNKNRPNCPINGLLITIPVDSLIQDDADQLERKGGRIARQLDLIQRTLGVRFPVFIVVTKADKLLGFRQFFTTLRDPQLQHQMLGWSNPQSLDEPFDPALVDEHLQQVRQRLMQRRLSRLLEDTSFDLDTEDSGRRTDHFDELYAFPEAMQRISSRLRRYLELIFVGGEWSSKPLFLRGIYFTSSMQHGEALDAELADALGVPVESLHEAAWTDDRAYFLRDVFIEKVFRERGLVTNATHTRARQRKRKTLLVGTGSLAVIILVVLIVWGYLDYKDTVGKNVEFWTEARTAYVGARAEQKYNANEHGKITDVDVVGNHRWRILIRDPESDDGADGPYIFNEDEAAPSGQMLREWLPDCQGMAGKELTTPLAFKLPALLTGGTDSLLKTERLEAAEELFRVGVIRPLVEAAQYRFEHEDPEYVWADENAAEALAQLVDLGLCLEKPAPRLAPPEGRTFKIAEMLLFSIPAEDQEAAGISEADPGANPNQMTELQSVCDWLYQEGLGEQPWAPAELAKAVDVGLASRQLDAFNKHWLAQLTTTVGPEDESGEMTPTQAMETLAGLDTPDSASGENESETTGEGRSLADLKLLRLALKCYWVLENDLLKQAEGETANLKQSWSSRPDENRRLWDERLGRLSEANRVAGNWLVKLEGDEELKAAWQAESRAAREEVRQQYDLLLAAAQGKADASIDDAAQLTATEPTSDEGEPEAAVEDSTEHNEIERLLIAGWRRIIEGTGQADSDSRLAEIEALDRLLLDMKADDRGETKRLFQIRFAMYGHASDALMAGEGEGGTGFGKTADELRGIESNLSDAIGEIDRLARQGDWKGENDPTDLWREDSAPRMAACRKLTAELVVKQTADALRRRDLVDGFIDRLRKAAADEDIARLEVGDIAKLVEGEAATSTCRVTRIPLTKLRPTRPDSANSGQRESGSPDADGRYCPLVVAGLVEDWNAVRDLVAEADKATIQRRIDEYVGNYVRYWSGDAEDSLIRQLLSFAPELDWSTFQSELAQYRYADFADGLTAIAKNIGEALETIPGQDMATQAQQSSIGREERKGYIDLLGKWKSLDENAQKARTDILLDKEIDGYFESYPTESPDLSNLARRFWGSFGRNALALLALETSGAASEAWKEIHAQHWKFPINPLASDQLPLEDVETVRSLVRSCISDAVARDAKTWNALPDDIIGSLEDLHAPLKQHRDELEQLSKLVNALPENGETLSVTVSLVRKDVPPTEYYGVDRVWPKLGVAQTDGESKIQVFTTQPKVYLLTLDHPGGEIHFSLYRERAATDPDPGVSFSKLGADGAMLSGPWSVLNMIRYADVAKPVSDTDDSWTVEFTVKPVSGEADYWLLLELVFDKPLPEDALRGWPSLKDE